ncbi:MAG: PBP1A family penicillin-binding protein [Peptococcaceae bacterium]|nr:PBP1A family penicillin-binding protein [Peptococcaceae bacterium]
MKDPRFPIESLSKEPNNASFTNSKTALEITRDTKISGSAHQPGRSNHLPTINPALSGFSPANHEPQTSSPHSKFDFSGATLGGSNHSGGSNNKSRPSNQRPGNSGKNKKPLNKKASLIKKILLVTLVVFLVGIISFGAFVWASTKDLSWDPELIDNLSYASIVYDSAGNQIAQLSSLENRLPFAYEDLPDMLIETIIAVEDQRFYKHGGFDPLRIVKGAINTLINPNKPEGGSTITTQLAKNTFIEAENRTSGGLKGIQRKVQELVLAMRIEREYEKKEILFTYLSQVYLGHGAYGVRSAAQVYFGKELDELTPSEIALICGLPQAPHSYDPYTNPESAQNRRTTVLFVMLNQGIIAEDDYTQFKEEPFTFVSEVQKGNAIIKMGSSTSEKHYPYFVDYVVSCLLDPGKYNLTHKQVYEGGLKIYTTVDPQIQAEAEKVMKDPSNFPTDAKDGVQVQGAFVMLENATGSVVAMAGGREYPEDQQRCFNRASEAKRQPGSCAKPIMVYAPALDKGSYFTGTVLDDCPTTFNGDYKPKNSSGGNLGLLTMREALRKSVNVYAVKLYEEAGPAYCFNFAKNLGLELADAESSYLSNALGSFEATPLEIARSYTAFPNKGMLNEVHCVTKIVDSNNRTILEPEPQAVRVMKESTAYIMCDLMQDAVEQGTGTNARISNWFVGGKTGTTDSTAYTGGPDIWFTGYTPLYTAAVWMGFDQSDKDHNLPSGEYGGNRPAQLWQKVMTKALQGKPRQATIGQQPYEVIEFEFDAFSGLLPGPLTPDDLIWIGLGTAESMPTEESNIWVSAIPGVTHRIGPVYLNMDPKFWTVMDRSPEKELKYRPPWESTDDRNDSAIPIYTASRKGNTISFEITSPLSKNSIYKSARVSLRNPDTKQYDQPAQKVTNLSRFNYSIPSKWRSQNTFEFQIVFVDVYGRETAPQTITAR